HHRVVDRQAERRGDRPGRGHRPRALCRLHRPTLPANAAGHPTNRPAGSRVRGSWLMGNGGPPGWTLRSAVAADVEVIAELRATVLRADLERLGRYDEHRVRQRLRDSFSPHHTSIIV